MEAVLPKQIVEQVRHAEEEFILTQKETGED